MAHLNPPGGALKSWQASEKPLDEHLGGQLLGGERRVFTGDFRLVDGFNGFDGSEIWGTNQLQMERISRFLIGPRDPITF